MPVSVRMKHVIFFSVAVSFSLFLVGRSLLSLFNNQDHIRFDSHPSPAIRVNQPPATVPESHP